MVYLLLKKVSKAISTISGINGNKLNKLILLLTIILCVITALMFFGLANECAAGEVKTVKATIDHTKIDEDLFDFPVILNLSTASGTNDFDNSGIFESLQDEHNKLVVTNDAYQYLYSEVESWDATNRRANLFVRLPVVRASQDTRIIIHFDYFNADNSSFIGITGSAVSEKVWDQDFISVYHMAQDPADGLILDSTNRFNGISVGSMDSNDLTYGQAGYSIEFDGIDDAVHLGSQINAYNQMTIEALFSVSSFSANRCVLAKGLGSAGEQRWGFRVDSTGMIDGGLSTPSYSSWIEDAATLSENTYYHISLNQDAGVQKVYLNGNEVSSQDADSASNAESYKDGFIGKDNRDRDFFKGTISEVRISSTARSDAWQKATTAALLDNLISYYEAEDSDGDYISDFIENHMYGSDPNNPDTDSDGLDDGDELEFWGENWNQDFDKDDLVNLIDPDSDNDGLTDGEEIQTYYTDPAQVDTDKDGAADAAEILLGYNPIDALIRPLIIYEDAEDGLTLGWGVYDGPADGVLFKNIFDEQCMSRVIEIYRDGTQGTWLNSEDGSSWNHSELFVISWHMNFQEDFIIYIDVLTTAGHRYIQYSSGDFDPYGIGEYIVYSIGADVLDGGWHRVVRDLRLDLARIEPEAEILSINRFMIRGSGRLDDIGLMDAAWDSDFDGVSDFDEVNLYGSMLDKIDTDSDGISDGQEINTYETEPTVADTDEDGILDGEELAYWGDNWKHDQDGDGLVNLVDSDSDNDGATDGAELNHNYDPANPAGRPATVYEDAQDGLVAGWNVYDGPIGGVQFSNVFDSERSSRVIDIQRNGSQGMRLFKNNGKPWRNPGQFVIGWRMRFANAFLIYIDVETTAGHRFVQYTPADHDLLGGGEYVIHGIGSDALDGRWHTYVRDLQSDLEDAQPGVSILTVNGFWIRGSGRLDDIQLMDPAWDGDGDGITDFNEVNQYGSDPDLFDSDGDGIGDGDEINVYGTRADAADTDKDGISDKDELAFWGQHWDADADADGLINLLDADADNDGVADGIEIDQELDPTDPDYNPALIYEDAEDGLTAGWQVYDGPIDGVTFNNVHDEELDSRVIEIVTSGSQGVRLQDIDGQPWRNPAQFVIGWQMKFTDSVLVYIDVETTAGHRFLQYSPVNTNMLNQGEYIIHGIGADALDGNWHHYIRDLQADLEDAQPGVKILEVNGFWLRGSGRIDNVCLMNRIWDGDGDSISDLEEVNVYGTNPATLDTDKDGLSDEAELSYWGADWRQDSDSDGLYNLVDADADNDGVVDGLELDFGFAPQNSDVFPVVETALNELDLGLKSDEQQGGGGLVGETIRIVNGNMIEYRSDLKFSSPNSLGLSFSATYNNRSDVSGILGYGWSHTYSAYLRPVGLISGFSGLKITDQTGRALYFKMITAGVYTGAWGEKSKVLKEAGEFVWYRMNGLRLGFSTDGQLNWIEDERFNRLNLAYDTQEQLETVTDETSGRVIRFNYKPDGLLGSISGPVTEAVTDGIWVTFGYDAGNLTSVTYADNSGYTYTYDDPYDPQNLTEKRNKADHLLNTWGYDDQDRCFENQSLNSNGVTVEYLSPSKVQVTDAYGTERTYDIAETDNQKRLTALTGLPLAPYSTENAVRWQYDDDMNLVEVEYGGGTLNRFQDFDDRGNPGKVIIAADTPEVRTLLYTYHPEINVALTRSEASVLGSGNKETVWDFDADGNDIPNENPGRMVRRIVEKGYTHDPDGMIVPYEIITRINYNAKGQVLSIDGPRTGLNDITSFEYDEANGNLRSIARPIIGSTLFREYDAAGQVGRVTDVNGQIEEFTYDARGRITAVKYLADSSMRTIQYNDAGLKESTTDEDGISRTFIYDPSTGRLQFKLDDDGNYIAYQYDDQGNQKEKSRYGSDNVKGSHNRWDYQHPTYPGQLWKTINFDESFTEYGYDGAGNVRSVRDPESHTTTYDYNAHNKPTSMTQPGNIDTRFNYDKQGNLISVVDGNNNQTTFIYDDLARLVSTTSPDTGTTRYDYDKAGNVRHKTDARGITTEYTYDDLNRLTGITYPDPSENVTYTYDSGTYGTGRRSGILDQSGSTSFAYDSRGRLTAKSSLVQGHNYYMERSFTPGGRLSSFTYPSGRRIDITRFALAEKNRGKLKKMTTTFAGNEVTLADVQDYDPFGAPSKLTNGAGGIVVNQSSACNCLEIANPGKPLEQVFTYDHNRNLKSVTGTYAPWLNQAYTYDALNRLTYADGSFGTYGFEYDDVGNRKTRTANGTTEIYEYYPDTNRLSNITAPGGAIEYKYDDNGNIIGIGDRTLVYNQSNRMVSVKAGFTELGAYAYNALGQRVAKTISTQTTVFHYDFDGNIIAESAPDGSFTNEYIYWFGNRTAMVDTSSGAIYYYLNDQLGTPQMMVDSNNKLVWEATYKPFGEALENPNSEVINNFRFAGQYYDAEIAWHYNYHRFYDPKVGRYLTPDPIGYLDGDNLYSYVKNNPVNWYDPLGLWTFQTGVSFTSGGVLGSTKGLGIIVSRDPSTGKWQFGWYAVVGAGAFVGAEAALAVDFTWSDNHCIEEAEGFALTAGASAGSPIGPGAGAEFSIPINGNTNPSYTFSVDVSLGLPAEGHVFVTYTHVNRIW